MVGNDCGRDQAAGAVTIAAAAANVLPFEIQVDLNSDGGWTLRSVRTVEHRPSGYNAYWHFVIDPDGPPTEAQRQTLARWVYHQAERPYASGGPGAHVQRWAFAGLDTTALEGLGNDGQAGTYTS